MKNTKAISRSSENGRLRLRAACFIPDALMFWIIEFEPIEYIQLAKDDKNYCAGTDNLALAAKL
jgi:hypothetical protein